MIYQEYIVEVKKNFSGDYEHNVYWVYDEDAGKARQKAESKYHAVLSEAAVSETAMHSAILFTSEGLPVAHKYYEHTIAEETADGTD